MLLTQAWTKLKWSFLGLCLIHWEWFFLEHKLQIMGFSAKIIGEIKNNKSTSLIISEITTVTCHLILAFTQQYLAKIKKKCVHLYLHFIITDFFFLKWVFVGTHTYLLRGKTGVLSFYWYFYRMGKNIWPKDKVNNFFSSRT